MVPLTLLNRHCATFLMTVLFTEAMAWPMGGKVIPRNAAAFTISAECGAGNFSRWSSFACEWVNCRDSGHRYGHQWEKEETMTAENKERVEALLYNVSKLKSTATFVVCCSGGVNFLRVMCVECWCWSKRPDEIYDPVWVEMRNTLLGSCWGTEKRIIQHM